MTLSRPLKPKTCAHCGHSFIPLKALQQVCGPLCASRLVRAKKAQGKKELRERKAALKTIPDLIKEAQVAFNAWTRKRDETKTCISCGKPLSSEGVGGGYDAGHYRSVGSASHLRFNQDNCHGQCKHCNRYGAGRAVDYRLGLVRRIGLDRVEALETDNEPRKWTREELIQIRDTYKAKLKALKERS